MTRALGPIVLLSLLVGCERKPAPARADESTPKKPSSAAAAPEPAQPEGEPKKYGLFADAIGIRIGLEAGFLREGQTLEFVVTHPESGARLDDATMTIGTPPDAIVIHSDERGRIPFPIRLELVEKNPDVRLVSPSTPHPEFELSFVSTQSFHCDERGIHADARERLEPDQLAKLRHEDFGPERVYAAASGVTDEHVRALGQHLVRLRAAYRKVTGWDPPPLHVLLTPEPRTVSVATPPGGPAVWTLAPEQITDADRSTAFLAHEWTHATLTARSSGAFEPAQRWIEDGLCDLVAYRVEKRMFPGVPATRLGVRARELALASSPEAFELLEDGTPTAKSFFGLLAAQCDGARMFGYGFAFAFWLAAVPDKVELAKVLRELDSEPLLGVARNHAAKAFADLRVERECAKQVVAGKRSCLRG